MRPDISAFLLVIVDARGAGSALEAASVEAANDAESGSVARVREHRFRVADDGLMTIERESTRDFEQHASGYIVERVDHREVERHPCLCGHGAHSLPDDSLGAGETDFALQF